MLGAPHGDAVLFGACPRSRQMLGACQCSRRWRRRSALNPKPVLQGATRARSRGGPCRSCSPGPVQRGAPAMERRGRGAQGKVLTHAQCLLCAAVWHALLRGW